jgi:hypothetical protein
MKDLRVLQRVLGGNTAEISCQELGRLLESAAVLRSEVTGVAGPIRILQLGERLLIQEESPRGEIFLRAASSRQAADSFVEERLATYERMWDGCGCRVNYRD